MKSEARWLRAGRAKTESGAHKIYFPRKPGSWCWPDRVSTPRGAHAGAEPRCSHLQASSQPPRSLLGRSSAARGSRPGAGPQESGEGAGLGSPPPPNMSQLPVPCPSEPTTMLSLQLTTDAPSPCWALKVWKVWEPTFRVSSSGGHKKGWGAEARLPTFLVAPPFPSRRTH